MATTRLARLRVFLADYVELLERRSILDRPWIHDDLHWVSGPDDGPEFHGQHLSRPGGRGPVTRQGWCACAMTRS